MSIDERALAERIEESQDLHSASMRDTQRHARGVGRARPGDAARRRRSRRGSPRRTRDQSPALQRCDGRRGARGRRLRRRTPRAHEHARLRRPDRRRADAADGGVDREPGDHGLRPLTVAAVHRRFRREPGREDVRHDDRAATPGPSPGFQLRGHDAGRPGAERPRSGAARCGERGHARTHRSGAGHRARDSTRNGCGRDLRGVRERAVRHQRPQSDSQHHGSRGAARDRAARRAGTHRRRQSRVPHPAATAREAARLGGRAPPCPTRSSRPTRPAPPPKERCSDGRSSRLRSDPDQRSRARRDDRRHGRDAPREPARLARRSRRVEAAAPRRARDRGRHRSSTRGNRRQFLIGSGVVLGGLALAACGRSSKSSRATTITAPTPRRTKGSPATSRSPRSRPDIENLMVSTYLDAAAIATTGYIGNVPPSVVAFTKTARSTTRRTPMRGTRSSRAPGSARSPESIGHSRRRCSILRTRR